MLSVYCPSCQSQFEAADDLPACELKCTACGHRFGQKLVDISQASAGQTPDAVPGLPDWLRPEENQPVKKSQSLPSVHALSPPAEPSKLKPAESPPTNEFQPPAEHHVEKPHNDNLAMLAEADTENLQSLKNAEQLASDEISKEVAALRNLSSANEKDSNAADLDSTSGNHSTHHHKYISKVRCNLCYREIPLNSTTRGIYDDSAYYCPHCTKMQIIGICVTIVVVIVILIALGIFHGL